MENAIRILDRSDVPVMILDHFDGRAHLVRQEIYVHPLGETEGGVGVSEAIGAAPAAG